MEIIVKEELEINYLYSVFEDTGNFFKDNKVTLIRAFLLFPGEILYFTVNEDINKVYLILNIKDTFHLFNYSLSKEEAVLIKAGRHNTLTKQLDLILESKDKGQYNLFIDLDKLRKVLKCSKEEMIRDNDLVEVQKLIDSSTKIDAKSIYIPVKLYLRLLKHKKLSTNFKIKISIDELENLVKA